MNTKDKNFKKFKHSVKNTVYINVMRSLFGLSDDIIPVEDDRHIKLYRSTSALLSATLAFRYAVDADMPIVHTLKDVNDAEVKFDTITRGRLAQFVLSKDFKLLGTPKIQFQTTIFNVTTGRPLFKVQRIRQGLIEDVQWFYDDTRTEPFCYANYYKIVGDLEPNRVFTLSELLNKFPYCDFTNLLLDFRSVQFTEQNSLSYNAPIEVFYEYGYFRELDTSELVTAVADLISLKNGHFPE